MIMPRLYGCCRGAVRRTVEKGGRGGGRSRARASKGPVKILCLKNYYWLKPQQCMFMAIYLP